MSERQAIPIKEHFADNSDELCTIAALIEHTDEMILRFGADLNALAFASDQGKKLFASADALLARGAKLTVFTLTDELRNAKHLELVGGAGLVTELITKHGCTPNQAEGYIARMRHKAAMRLLGEDAAYLALGAANWGTDPFALANEVKRRAERILLRQNGGGRSKWEDVFSRGALSGRQLRELEIIPRAKLLGDWLAESDLGFLFAARGVGKTWLALLMAVGIADNKPVGPWKPAGAHPVLYIDGEMPLELIQTRNALLADTSDNLHYINHEWLFEQTGEVLNLTDGECQRAVTALCQEWKIKVLVLDNLSCLFRGVSENDADAWELILPWLLELRRKKIAVIFVVHAGRNGQMRGTSRREDPAAWVVRLDDATDATSARTGAKFVSSFTKPSRNTQNNPPPLEWSITTNAGTGKAQVVHKAAEGAEAVLGWVRDGLTSPTDIAREMHLSVGQVSKLATKLIEAGKLKKDGRGYATADESTNVSEIR